MSINVRPNTRELAFLVGGVVLGISLFGLYSGGHLYQKIHSAGVTMYSWPGPSSARESHMDKAGDGTPEGWIMTMAPNNKLTLEASLTDADLDGVYDLCKVEMRPEGSEYDGFMLAAMDTDKNGHFDGVQFSNTGSKGMRYTDYKDWDLDGFLDYYTDRSRNTSWIATGTEWLKVVKRVDTEEYRFVVERNGENREMVYRGGAWSDVTPVR